MTGNNGGDPAVTKEYTITLTKLARVDSSDATLSDISLGEDVELAPTFNKDTRVYLADVDYTVEMVTVAPTATDTTGAEFEITPEDSEAGGDHQVALVEGDNTIVIEVTAEDGTTTRSYEVTVTRRVRSTDSSLSDLTLKDDETEELNQAFSSGRTSYTADVDVDVTSLSLTATASDSSSVIVVRVSGGDRWWTGVTVVYTRWMDWEPDPEPSPSS